MTGDVLLAIALSMPLAIAAVATAVAPRRLRWIVKAGVVFAAGLLVLSVFFFRDAEWGTEGALVLGLIIAAVALFLWAVGVAVGWAIAHAVGRKREPA